MAKGGGKSDRSKSERSKSERSKSERSKSSPSRSGGFNASDYSSKTTSSGFASVDRAVANRSSSYSSSYGGNSSLSGKSSSSKSSESSSSDRGSILSSYGYNPSSWDSSRRSYDKTVNSSRTIESAKSIISTYSKESSYHKSNGTRVETYSGYTSKGGRTVRETATISTDSRGKISISRTSVSDGGDGNKGYRGGSSSSSPSPSPKVETPKITSTTNSNNEPKDYNYVEIYKEINKYVYTFGIDKADILKKHPIENSGWISEEIEIGYSSFIELSVIQTKTDASTEFYIIEDGKEYPICPAEHIDVKNEKLFPNLSTRFKPHPDYPITIKCNNLPSDIKFKDISTLDFSNNTYTISYTPIRQSYHFFPEAKKIKVKVIERVYKGTMPSVINSITILKHGGGKIWDT